MCLVFFSACWLVQFCHKHIINLLQFPIPKPNRSLKEIAIAAVSKNNICIENVPEDLKADINKFILDDENIRNAILLTLLNMQSASVAMATEMAQLIMV